MLDEQFPKPEDFTLRPLLVTKPSIIVVGASTGGPKAILEFLSELEGVKQPILIAQHIPDDYTKSVAQQLENQTGIRTFEASDQMPIEPSTVYIAPGNFHMMVCMRSIPYKIILNQDPPEHFCRPAVDPLFRSAAEYFRHLTLGVVLTGIGHDGLQGAQEIVKNGGQVFAQDKKTSIVWGMPGSVAKAGLASACAAPKDLALLTMKLCREEMDHAPSSY